MNHIRLCAACSLFGLVVPASGAVPKKRLYQEYEVLWQSSLFTTPSVEAAALAPPPLNPVEDYTLAGLSKVEGGWFVILMNKKDRTQRVRLVPNASSDSGFQVTDVENPSSRQVRVQITSGTDTGWVSYDPAFLTLRAAGPATPPQPGVQVIANPNREDSPELKNGGSRVHRVPMPPNVPSPEEPPRPDLPPGGAGSRSATVLSEPSVELESEVVADVQIDEPVEQVYEAQEGEPEAAPEPPNFEEVSQEESGPEDADPNAEAEEVAPQVNERPNSRLRRFPRR